MDSRRVCQNLLKIDTNKSQTYSHRRILKSVCICLEIFTFEVKILRPVAILAQDGSQGPSLLYFCQHSLSANMSSESSSTSPSWSSLRKDRALTARRRVHDQFLRRLSDVDCNVESLYQMMESMSKTVQLTLAAQSLIMSELNLKMPQPQETIRPTSSMRMTLRAMQLLSGAAQDVKSE